MIGVAIRMSYRNSKWRVKGLENLFMCAAAHGVYKNILLCLIYTVQYKSFRTDILKITPPKVSLLWRNGGACVVI